MFMHLLKCFKESTDNTKRSVTVSNNQRTSSDSPSCVQPRLMDENRWLKLNSSKLGQQTDGTVHGLRCYGASTLGY